MKLYRRFFSIAILLSFLTNSFAQLSILNEQGDEIIGTTINIAAGVPNDYYFIVKNESTETISDIRCYLRINANENAEYGTDAEWEFYSTQCGINGSCPKFTLAPGAEQQIHLTITTLSTTNFVVTVYPTGGSPEANFNIEANNYYTIIACSIEPWQGTVTGGGIYQEGTDVTLIANAAYGYHFTEWNDGVTDNTRIVNVLSDTLFAAYFDNNDYEIVVESANNNMGTVDGGDTYRYMDSIIINANANDGYIFVRWNDGNTENPRLVTVERDSTFTATFGILKEMSKTDCANYDLGGGYVFDSTGVHYGFFTNAEGIDSVVRLNLTIEQPIETSIMIVSTNENNKNVVTWHPVSNNTMLGYLMYRQDAYGQFEVVDTVAIENECSWTDEVSNTAVRPYRYAVATYDSCGNISAMSASHRTIHLQISLGQGNSRNLSWTDYEGIDFSTYRVYRGTSIGDLEMVMEMSRENHTYTDFDVQHDYFYQIEIVQGMKSVVISRSNIVSTNPGGITDIEGIDISEIALFPNPASDILNITSSEIISEIEIENTLGQVVKRIEINADNAVCDVEDLKAGLYIVRIYGTNTESVVCQRKFIKE